MLPSSTYSGMPAIRGASVALAAQPRRPPSSSHSQRILLPPQSTAAHHHQTGIGWREVPDAHCPTQPHISAVRPRRIDMVVARQPGVVEASLGRWVESACTMEAKTCLRRGLTRLRPIRPSSPNFSTRGVREEERVGVSEAAGLVGGREARALASRR